MLKKSVPTPTNIQLFKTDFFLPVIQTQCLRTITCTPFNTVNHNYNSAKSISWCISLQEMGKLFMRINILGYVLKDQNHSFMILLITTVTAFSLFIFIQTAVAFTSYASDQTLSPIFEVNTRTEIPFNSSALVNSTLSEFGSVCPPSRNLRSWLE